MKFGDITVFLNKRQVTERQYDTVLDHVYHLNEDTPKLKCEGTSGVSPDLVFGLDTKLFSLSPSSDDTKDEWDGRMDRDHHYQEVDVITVADPTVEGCEGDKCGHVLGHEGHEHAGDEGARGFLLREGLDKFLESLSKDDIYRVKGLVWLQEVGSSDGSLYVLNWAFGRYTLTSVDSEGRKDVRVRVTVMGQGLRMYLERVRVGFAVGKGNVIFTPAGPRRT